MATPTIMQSTTKKWALFGSIAIVLLQGVKLVTPQEYHAAIDKVSEAISLATGVGVTVGMRDAVSKNGNGR